MSESEFAQKQHLANEYTARLREAKKGRGYHNCAGFVKYLLGITKKETYAPPNDPSPKGIMAYLKQHSILDLKEFTDKEYVAEASKSDVGAFLRNNKGDWKYLHFFVPNPDPNHPFQVFQRNGFEEEEAELADIRDVMKDKEYKEETLLVFFVKK